MEVEEAILEGSEDKPMVDPMGDPTAEAEVKMKGKPGSVSTVTGWDTSSRSVTNGWLSKRKVIPEMEPMRLRM